MKFDTESLDQTVSEIVRKISTAIPEDLKIAKEELEKNARATLEGVFQRLDLITREEFDVQVMLLSKSQRRVKELEQRIRELEKLIEKNKIL
jgi:BMFP domain-containing protein YqiC